MLGAQNKGEPRLPFFIACEREPARPVRQDSTSSRLKISVWSLYEKISA
jgi:hypothetical protein